VLWEKIGSRIPEPPVTTPTGNRPSALAIGNILPPFKQASLSPGKRVVQIVLFSVVKVGRTANAELYFLYGS
jgi:hypothetical protein